MISAATRRAFEARVKRAKAPYVRFEMTIDDVERHLTNKPFKPFRLVLRDGDQLDVMRSRLQVAFGLTRLVYVSPNGERRVELGVDQIAGIEILDAAAAS